MIMSDAEAGTFAEHDRNPYRLKRMEMFVALLDEVLAKQGECRILDIGGTQSYWMALEEAWRGRNVHITVANLEREATTSSRFTGIAGDARKLELTDNSFDVVHSNSVIEHVGSFEDMRRMAGEVRRLAPRYFVQTPNFWFPVEPHFRTPAFHYLPKAVRLAIVKRRACGFYPKAQSDAEAQKFIDDASLISMRQMRLLFPDATVHRENFYGLSKSLIAVR
jgi:2-polyprenyl-3-methyl-5-hydroxy-6-metoxy-1,4-benzoquinol methylase